MENNLKLQDIIDSKILSERKVFLWGQVDDNSAKQVIERLLYLELLSPKKEIQLIINSPGGYVTSGFAIYDAIKGITSPVSTICTGYAASMASIILSAGEKGRRLEIGGLVRGKNRRAMSSQCFFGFGHVRRLWITI